MRTLITLTALVLTASFATAQDGPTTFKQKCAMCHSADGSGSSAMGKKLGARDLRSPEVQKLTDAQISDIVAKGKGKMPPYAKQLQPPALKAVVEYVRALGKK